MDIKGVAIIPRCAECEAHWLPADQERWQAWLTYDEPPEVVFYCPTCAEREFGFVQPPFQKTESWATGHPCV